MARSLPILALFAALLALSGCGSGSASTEAKTAILKAKMTQAQTQAKATARQVEQSVKDYGSAATGAEKSQILAAWHSYLSAYASRDYPRLCAMLPASFSRGELAMLAVRTRVRGCPALLARTSGTQPATARKDLAGEVKEIRARGEGAYVIFTPRGASKPLAIVMVSDGGTWKPATLNLGRPLALTSVPPVGP